MCLSVCECTGDDAVSPLVAAVVELDARRVVAYLLRGAVEQIDVVAQRCHVTWQQQPHRGALQTPPPTPVALNGLRWRGVLKPSQMSLEPPSNDTKPI